MLDKTIIPITMLFTKYHSIFYIIKYIRNIVNINLRKYYAAFDGSLFYWSNAAAMGSIFETEYMSAFLDKLGNILMVMGTIALGLTVGFQGRNKSSVESNTNKK